MKEKQLVESDYAVCTMHHILTEIRQCRVCENYIVPNPVVSISSQSKIIVIGQAPGRIVHETGIPWNDKSGDNLRLWLQVDKPTFYDNTIFGIMPMGFCFPGTGKSGDLPPRLECAPLWHDKLLAQVEQVRLTLLIGQFAQAYYLKQQTKETLTETVKHFATYLPQYFVLPHPSPRNNIWMAKNKWFQEAVLPVLRSHVANIVQGN
ncbi:MAG: uracil-DNA glycosylase family protein [Chitinophagales bacterium]|nr:uracil-DNA glycosylase family protein [Chitinophagales bacterium]